MRAYWSVMTARFRTLLQYRAAAVAGFGTQLFWGLIRLMIFSAFYQSTTARQPLSFEDVTAYVWIGQALFVLIPWNVDPEIMAMIRSGNVVYELLRPLDLYTFWFSRVLSFRLAPALMRAVPMFIVAGLFLGLKPPASIASGLAFAASLFAALLLACAVTTFISICLLWTIAGDGVRRIMSTVIYVFSGLMVPLPLFPQWAESVLRLLPFAGVFDTPVRLYIGQLPPSHIGMVLANQLIWTIIIILAGRWLLSIGTRRVVVHGG